MEQLYNYLPEKLVTFILVTLFSLLIGLSQRKISLKREGETTLFGTDRTFTFIGMLGYLLYILDPEEMHLFMGGGLILGILLGLNYYVKQSQFHVFRGDDYYHRTDHLLHCSDCVYTAFMVLRYGDCYCFIAYRTEAYFYGDRTANEKR